MITTKIPAMVPGSVSSGVIGRVSLIDGAGFSETGILQSGPENMYSM